MNYQSFINFSWTLWRDAIEAIIVSPEKSFDGVRRTHVTMSPMRRKDAASPCRCDLFASLHERNAEEIQPSRHHDDGEEPMRMKMQMQLDFPRE
jgi:hypothetical protein